LTKARYALHMFTGVKNIDHEHGP